MQVYSIIIIVVTDDISLDYREHNGCTHMMQNNDCDEH